MVTFARSTRRWERTRHPRAPERVRPGARPHSSGRPPTVPLAPLPAPGPPDTPAVSARDEASRLVRREVGRYRTWRLDAADLRQAGWLGVQEAAARFTPDRGSFAGYASFWVRKEIQRALASGEFAVTLPADYPNRAVALRRVLVEVGGDVVAAGARLGLPADAVAPLLALVDARSLDDLVTGGGRDIDLVGDSGSVEDGVVVAIERAAVRRAVAALPDAQRLAMVFRFGLDGGGERSHREVARVLGISDFTARRLVARASEALRAALAPHHPNPAGPG